MGKKATDKKSKKELAEIKRMNDQIARHREEIVDHLEYTAREYRATLVIATEKGDRAGVAAYSTIVSDLNILKDIATMGPAKYFATLLEKYRTVTQEQIDEPGDLK